MRSPRVATLLALLAASLASSAGLVGCGSRTGLLVTDFVAGEGSSASTSSSAGTSSSASSASRASSTHVAPGCADAGPTSIYVVTDVDSLFSFDPSSNRFARVGTVGCYPANGGPSPFSMAVARGGTAYVLFNDSRIGAVNIANASCTLTAFQPPLGFDAGFGMGFASNQPAPGETLYIAGYAGTDLATLDPTTFALKVLGPVPKGVELTGSGAGDLYAFYATPSDSTTTTIQQLDKSNGAPIGTGWTLSIPLGGGWAFAYWGGDFYTFTGDVSSAPDGTVVHRFDPTTQRLTPVAKLAEKVVGAGVSTCAPGQ